MQKREFKIIQLLNANDNSNIYLIEPTFDIGMIEGQNGKMLVLKQYNHQNNFGENFGKFKKIVNLSFKINGLCKIIGTSTENDIFLSAKSGREHQVKGIIMEYISGITLEKFIKNGGYNNRQINKIIINLSEIIYDMHKNLLAHRDLKPANIIVNSKGEITIIDLDYAKVAKQFKQQSGTLMYIAPEIIKGEIYNHKVDIYSFGAIIYRLIAREEIADCILTDDEKSDEVMRKLSKGYGEIIDKLIDKSHWDNRWKEIVKNCLKSDPKERWDADKLNKYVKENFLLL